MKSKIKFGRWETVALIMNLICMQVFLGFPRTMAERAATAGWIQALDFSILVLLTFAVISRLYKSVEGMDIVDIGEYIGGTFGRVSVGIIYVLYTVFGAFITLRDFSENMKTIVVPNSPLSFVTLFFMVAIVSSAYIGLEAIVRFHSLIVPIILLGLVVILTANWSNYNVDNIIPFLGNGPREIFTNSLSGGYYFSGIISILFISPFIGGRKNFAKAGYSALILSSIVLTVSCLCYMLMNPNAVAARNFLPIYSMAREISFGRFIQRGEAVFVFVWAASGMLNLSAVFYFTLLIMRKAFKLEYVRPLIIPLAMIIFALSFLPQSLMAVLRIEGKYFIPYTWILVMALPILLLSLAALKKRRNKEVRKCQN